MKIEETGIEGLKLFTPEIFQDHRGWFLELFKEKNSSEQISNIHFVQENISFSKKGVLRGMHFQQPPYGQAKLVTALTGKLQDVVIDLREGSKSFKKTFSCELSADRPRMLMIPEGFAHGFLALEDSHFYYKCSNYYTPEYEAGILWNDAELNIKWQMIDPILSEKDKNLLSLAEFLRKSVISRKY